MERNRESGDEAGRRVVVSVLIADRTGILRDITTALADLGANIDAIRQTVVEGYFTVLLTATFPEDMPGARVREALEKAFSANEASIAVRPLGSGASLAPRLDVGGHVLSISGLDRPGILKRATACLGDAGVNIEDLVCLREEARVTYLAELSIPAALSASRLEQKLRDVLADMAMRCRIQRANIFAATSGLGPIRSLRAGGAHA